MQVSIRKSSNNLHNFGEHPGVVGDVCTQGGNDSVDVGQLGGVIGAVGEHHRAEVQRDVEADPAQLLGDGVGLQGTEHGVLPLAGDDEIPSALQAGPASEP